MSADDPDNPGVDSGTGPAEGLAEELTEELTEDLTEDLTEGPSTSSDTSGASGVSGASEETPTFDVFVLFFFALPLRAAAAKSIDDIVMICDI
jgi:hypothetical protein